MELSPKTPWDLAPDGPAPLTENREADTVVVGGGFTGLALAYHLKRLAPRREIVLIEADRIGAGASGRTGGVLMNGTSSDDYPGTDRAIAAISETIHREGISCELRLPGCLEMDRQGNSNGRPVWNDQGPLAPVGTVAGGDFHPTLFLQGLKSAARRWGVTIAEKSPVIDLSANGRIVLQTPTGRVVAGQAVFATNHQFLKPLQIRCGFTPYNTYAIATERLSPSLLAEIGWGRELPFYTLSLPFLWGRTTLGGRIIIGSGLSTFPKIKAEMLEQLEERFHSLHPALETVKVEYRWWGPISIPHDWTPKILTSPADPSILYLGGYAGHGCALSHLFAERTAAFLAGDATALKEFSWAREAHGTPFDRAIAKIGLKVANYL